MSKRGTWGLLPFAYALLALAGVEVLACSCAYNSPCAEFGKARMIFTGRMLEGSEKVWAEKDKDGNVVSHEAGAVRFAVEEVFKGDRLAEITLTVRSNKDTSCAYSMVRGERYLVYAYEHEGRLSTGMCTRTTRLADNEAKEDLEFLRNPPAPGSGGKLTGTIWLSEGDGKAKALAGIKVVLRSEDERRIETVTDKEGQFQLIGLKSGKYKVEPDWPKHYVNHYPNKEIEVVDQSCAEIDFEARINGRASGQVLDAKGRAASVTLLLEPVEPKNEFHRALSIADDEGNFEIEGLAPNRYLLYFELHSNDRKKKYYYPGVWERSEATIIELPMGQHRGGYDFPLPPEFIVQTVEGKANWANGTPAANVEVLFLCPRNARPEGYTLEFGAVRATTDEEGRFKLQGFKGNVYWLEARGRKAEAIDDDRTTGSHSPARRLTLLKDLTNVNLVLSLPGFTGSGCK